MRKVSSFSIGALAVLLLTFLLLGCGGGRSAPTGSNLKSMPAGRTIDLNETLAELDALQAPAGVDPVIFNQLKDSLRGALVARGKIVAAPPAEAVNDLLEVTPVTTPPTIAWSSNFFRGDGSGDGTVGVSDVTQLAMEFGADIGADPTAMYADYNRDGVIGVADVTTLAMQFAKNLGSFDVEWSETETGTYALAGNVPFTAALPDPNANNFKVWNYQFGAGVLPAVPSVWVRVTPRDTEGVAGVASAPLEIELEPIVIRDFYITGIRVTATNTVNTDAGDPVNIGTDDYVAGPGGLPTEGEVQSNALVTIDLKDVFYTWKGIPYGPDDPLPADLTQAALDAYIDEAKGYMSYLVLSIDGVEGWTESATQPPTGYEGRIGPNDDLVPPNVDGGAITATLADYDATQGNASFQVAITYGQIPDPNAPAVVDLSPLTQPQNINNQVHAIRGHFGADEVGDEMPVTVALLNRATGAVAYTFTPATVVETPDPPTTPGEYTFNRVGIMGSTIILRVMVPATQLSQGINYAWRFSEDVAGFELKSSRLKPANVLNIVGPQLFDMNTWPEADFYWDDARAPFLYFVPEDPLIRRNPHGGMDDPLAQFPQWEFNDQAAADDLVKSTGEEFLIIFGERLPPNPPEPDSPMIYYSAGTDAPQTVGDADGQLPVTSRSPHLLACIAGVMPSAPGDYSFSLFSQEGDFLGSVTRYHQDTPILRMEPFVTGADFGVRPWGLDGSNMAPDFSDKTASQGSNDVVVFTFYNMWLRHDDSDSLPEAEKGSRLILTDVLSSADLNDIKMTPAIMSSEFQGGLCYMTLDIAKDDIWIMPITMQIPIGEYQVSLVNPGSGGRVTYLDNLWITP